MESSGFGGREGELPSCYSSHESNKTLYHGFEYMHTAVCRVNNTMLCNHVNMWVKGYM